MPTASNPVWAASDTQSGGATSSIVRWPTPTMGAAGIAGHLRVAENAHVPGFARHPGRCLQPVESGLLGGPTIAWRHGPRPACSPEGDPPAGPSRGPTSSAGRARTGGTWWMRVAYRGPD